MDPSLSLERHEWIEMLTKLQRQWKDIKAKYLEAGGEDDDE